MVKVAIAGGSGQVAREIIDVLVAEGKHEVTIMSRKTIQEPQEDEFAPSIGWKMVDYGDKTSLAQALTGIHTVLSFVQTLSDPGQVAQRNLIDASIAAGVKRFAPSEYGSKETTGMPWCQVKESIREYLEKVTNEGSNLEYTLFQPGLFLNYVAFPHKTSKHLEPLQALVDFENKRAILVKDYEDSTMTFTTVQDVAAIVARALDYQGKWPKNGGICGNRLTLRQLADIGERVLGCPFTVEKVELKDLEAGDLTASWHLEARHSAIPEEEAKTMLRTVTIGLLLSISKGAWDSSDEMSRLFPDYRLTSTEEFLGKVWGSNE
ncbi:hypothetical protein B0I35DRAFT_369735 [Stachybotrys elegans]|uniref:NmrA-like domain-containing protein n=1 Tax=Stachybotrys elegans TaxID=80388 RepID=A0A8K0WTR3_9HYPO|nr:hypothetical protein B0I35DRAFT_369735 [Stachybotrys elegans]